MDDALPLEAVAAALEMSVMHLTRLAVGEQVDAVQYDGSWYMPRTELNRILDARLMTLDVLYAQHLRSKLEERRRWIATA